MIYLKKGQPLLDNPGMVVYDSTGYYNDGDSIICAPVFAPEEPACRYEAQYIAYGGIIYSVSNPDELMEQILKIDPKSLFGKDSQQVAVDKIVEQIVPQESAEIVAEDPEVVDPVDEQVSTTTPPVNIPTPAPIPTPDPINVGTTTPPVIDMSSSTPPIDLSTTTQPIIMPTSTPSVGISSTTPPVIDIATSTPPFDVTTSTLPVDFSTTTPPVETSTTTDTVLKVIENIFDSSSSTTTPIEKTIEAVSSSTQQ